MKKKNVPASIGVWMDHSEARLIDLGKKFDKILTITPPGKAAQGFRRGG